ncbi:MAG: serine/threonine protein kinase, partial [Oscillochloris sp.]|nr:serine/threonine protein kinase [Oscillochloris sp.]
ATPPKPRRGFFGTLAMVISWMLTICVVVLIILGGYIYTARPSWADPLLAPLNNLMPTSTPTTLTSQQVEITVTIQVPSGSTDSAIRSALQAAFAATAKAQYGEGALVNQSVPPSPIGSAVQVGGADANNLVTYQARMKGFIYRP